MSEVDREAFAGYTGAVAEPLVLVIDDDMDVTSMLCAYLKGRGFRATAALDGVSGLLRVHQEKPELIILDYSMPGGDGRTVYDRLQMSCHTVTLPVIFISAIPLEQLRKAVPASSKVDFLKKPIDFPALDAAMRRLLLGRGAAPSSVGGAGFTVGGGGKAAAPRGEEADGGLLDLDAE